MFKSKCEICKSREIECVDLNVCRICWRFLFNLSLDRSKREPSLLYFAKYKDAYIYIFKIWGVKKIWR